MTRVKDLIIIGGNISGQLAAVLEVLRALDTFKLVGFIDKEVNADIEYHGEVIPYLGSSENLDNIDLPDCHFHIAVGDNFARASIMKRLFELNKNLATLVHPKAYVSPRCEIGEGVFVGVGATINGDTAIGDAVIIEAGSVIQHNSEIGDAVCISSGACVGARVTIEAMSFVGMDSSILPDILISKGALIGAGIVVSNDVSPNSEMSGYSNHAPIKNIYSDVILDADLNQKTFIAQPTLPEFSRVDAMFQDIVKTRMLSNFAKYSKKLEKDIERALDVKHALTFPNATSALMLTFRAMELTGEIILPSFTFSSTGHSLIWNGLTPVFADIDPKTFNIDPQDVINKITDKTSAIYAVHIFGNPCDVESLQAIADEYGLKLIYDSAHALGSKRNGINIGNFGDIESFSLSGTKVLTSAEGGIVTLKDKSLSDKLMLGRNYGASDDYDCQYIGLNGKMSEFHAAIAIESLTLLDKSVFKRNAINKHYRMRLKELPGIFFQEVSNDDLSTYKDMGIVIDKTLFGMNRDQLISELEKEGISTKKYFYPPLHQMKAYMDLGIEGKNLPNTEYVANNIMCLPMYTHMTLDTVDKICFAIFRISRKLNCNPSSMYPHFNTEHDING
jgi:sugar O-acyltransferase (sialic acid O-acetyltransferase NeuD family)